MKPRNLLPILFLLSTLATSSATAEDTLYTSPNGGGRAAILTEIRHAKTEILVFAYAFQSRLLADDLIAATRRGVRVRILMDRLQSTNKSAKTADLAKGCTFFGIVHSAGAMHAKTMILDREVIITGSYNWTDAAEAKNVEHLYILRQPQLAQRLADHWATLANQPLDPPSAPDADVPRHSCQRCQPASTQPRFSKGPHQWSNLPAR
jgi:phosphatidylserine/phosphatidylglycerophosphate/cardiolipin synthase-like enzyme